MEREGNTTEQPVAPDSNVASDMASAQPAASVEQPPIKDQIVASEQPITNQSGSVIVDNLPNNGRTRDKKKLAITIGAAAAVVLLVVGVITLLAANISNNNGNNGTTSTVAIDDNVTTTEAEATVNQLAADSDIYGMIDYINGIINSYNSGINFQNMTKEEIGNLTNTGIKNILSYMGDNANQRNSFGETLVKYTHTADDIFQTAETATNVVFAELNYGNKEVAEQYKQIAIDRGSQAYDSNPNERG